MTAPALLPVDVLIRTRYGMETHHDTGQVHVAGPSCPCKPEITWRTK